VRHWAVSSFGKPTTLGPTPFLTGSKISVLRVFVHAA
jgi:hypothetical protein